MMPDSSVELPVFDISQPLSPAGLLSLYQACSDWGFFHITNHGVSGDLRRKLHTISNQVFSLSSETKLRIGPSSSLKTYTPHFIASPYFESLRVSGPDFLASSRISMNVLFEHPESEFSKVLEEYGNKMTELCKKIVKAILACLGADFESKFYESEFGDCHGYLRINNYSTPEAIDDRITSQELVEGLGMHTDMSCVTIVNQDAIGGLQVRSKDGEWMDIDPCEETLVVNVGDLMHAWSNGQLRSSEHRVVLRQPRGTRFSVAFFWCFVDEKLVLAPPEVVGETGSRMFKPFVCRDYMKFRENVEKGRFDKVGYTVRGFAGVGG